MARKKCALATRAWSMIRLALWARKGGIFKRGFMGGLKFLSRGPRHSEITSYLSFGDSPTVPLNLPRSIVKFPCMNPSITLDNDDCDTDIDSDGVDDRYGAGYDHDHGDDHCHQGSYYDGDGDGDGDASVDSKADEFIERFYQQMRLQRQLSCLKYNEMLHRGIS
ncbi:hypothetical protein AMTRI_Chr12g241000 [Amborella trichopoda]